MSERSSNPTSLKAVCRLRLLNHFCITLWVVAFMAFLTSTVLSVEYDSKLIAFGWNIDFHFDRGAFAMVLWENPQLSGDLGFDAGWHRPGLRSQLGLDWTYLGMFTGARVGIVRFPWWIVLGVLAIPPLALRRITATDPVGHCTSCGYDLHANTSGRCPECGIAI